MLAHDRCGAVTAAVDAYLDPRRYIEIATDPALRAIQDHILVAVRIASLSMEQLYGIAVKSGPGYRAALIEAAVVINAAWSAYCLQQEFPALAGGVVFGAYDLSTRYVRMPLSRHAQSPTTKKASSYRPKTKKAFTN